MGTAIISGYGSINWMQSFWWPHPPEGWVNIASVESERPKSDMNIEVGAWFYRDNSVPIPNTITRPTYPGSLNYREWGYSASADAYNLGVTYDELLSACPNGICSGVLNGYSVTGWKWAGPSEICGLLDVLFNGLPNAGGAPDYPNCWIDGYSAQRYSDFNASDPLLAVYPRTYYSDNGSVVVSGIDSYIYNQNGSSPLYLGVQQTSLIPNSALIHIGTNPSNPPWLYDPRVPVPPSTSPRIVVSLYRDIP